jgi:SAM-dependent methyltransferase
MNKIKKIINLIVDFYQTLLISCISKNNKFSYIYKSKYWKGAGEGSLSGAGSNENTTQKIKYELQGFFKKKKIQSILDIPCGDWKWMSTMDFQQVNYIGCDVVKEMIEKNSRLYARDNIKFMVKSLIDDDLPNADLIIVRDLLVHLDTSDILKCLENIKRNNFEYIAITNYPTLKSQHKDKILGDKWRPINLSMEPFSLIDPEYNLDDTSMIQDHDKGKYLSVWSNKKFIRRNG